MDFSKLRFNFTKGKKDQLVIDKFPELKEIREFNDPDRDYLLKAVILMLEPESPFIKERDYKKIVENVFTYLDPKDHKTPYDLLTDTYTNDIRDLKEMMFVFFIFMDNHAFTVWYSKLIDFHYMLNFLQSKPDIDKPDHFEKRMKVSKAVPELHKSLVEYENFIFPHEIAKKIIKEQTVKAATFAERFAQEYGIT